MKKQAYGILAAVPMMLTMPMASFAAKGNDPAPLFLTATNGAVNYLAVVNSRTKEIDYVPTGGAGGAGGNAGGVAVEGRLAAAVNFGSSNVTIFVRRGDAMQPIETIATASKPLSVTFGHNHLFVLGQTTVESFPVFGQSVGANADGSVQLAKADNSAAQVVSFDGGVIYTEKSGSIAWLNMSGSSIGAGLSGPNMPVSLPAAPNNDTPFGIVARGANVYATIAHSDTEALIVNGRIVSTAAGPVPYKDASGGFLHAPCWNTLAGQFLYSSDSPGKQLLRYLVSDVNIFFDKPSVATLSGAPTDLAADGTLLGVIDGRDGMMSNASLFDIDLEGELKLRFAVKITGPINGAAIMQ
jgi:hypothetical protein